jgi:hypothetical protein
VQNIIWFLESNNIQHCRQGRHTFCMSILWSSELALFSLIRSWTMMTEAAFSSKILVNTDKTAWHHSQEDHNLNVYCSKNFTNLAFCIRGGQLDKRPEPQFMKNLRHEPWLNVYNKYTLATLLFETMQPTLSVTNIRTILYWGNH